MPNQAAKIVAFLLCLTAAHSRAADSVTFENKDLAIRFIYPAALTPASPPPAGTEAMLLSKPDKPGEFQENIQLKVINDPKAATAGYLKIVGDGMSKAVQARGAKLDETAETTVAKTSAVKITYTTKLGATDVKLQTVCFAKGEKIFCLIAAASADKFDAFYPSFKQAIDSFEFISDKPAMETKPVVETKPKPDPKPVTETKPPANPAIYESTELGLKISYPTGWSPHKVADPTILIMLFPDSRAPSRLMTVTAEPVAEGPPPTLRELLDLSLAGFKGSTAPAARIIESKDVKLGGERARQAIMAGKNTRGDVEIKAVYLILIRDKKIITFSAQAPATDFNAVKESFDAMTATTEFGVPSLKKE